MKSLKEIPNDIYYELYSQNADAILIINHTKIIDWNQRAESLLGLSINVGNDYSIESISPERQFDGELSKSKALKCIMEAKQNGSCHFQWLHTNRKTLRTFLSDVHLVKLKSKATELYIATVRDITERINRENEIYNAKLKYKLLVEYSNDIIEIISPQGKILFLSGPIEKILGYTLEEALNQTVFDLIHHEDLERVLSVMAKGLEQHGSKHSVEYRYRHKLGHYVYLEATGCNLIKEPAVAGLFLTIKNIDERRRYEELLLEAKQSAEDANESKSHFLANMSHEIRTPLSAIIGWTKLLSDTVLNDEQTQFLKYIVSSSNHLKTLIDDVLDFSKIEAKMLELETEWTNIIHLIKEVTSIFKIAAEKKNIDLNVIVPSDMPKLILIDGLRLKQILINLLGNALKFTSQGSVTLRLLCSKAQYDAIYTLTFFIDDTGIGIDKDQQKILFKAFKQADSSTTRKFGGTGLGLIISEMLANKMGASIKLVSEIGKGSSFYFTLNVPFCQDLIEPLQIEEEAAPVNFDSSITILLADDMDLNRLLLRKMLAKLNSNFNVYEAKDGKEAFDIFLKHKPKLIFLDLQMPIMDGFEVAKHIRSFEESNQIASCLIFALTASVLNEDRTKSLEIGMNGYITKPFELDDLIKALNQTQKRS